MNELLELERKWVKNNPNALTDTHAYRIRTTVKAKQEQLERVRELLSCVHLLSFGEDVLFSKLASELPKWFLDRSSQSLSEQEMSQWLIKWRSADSDIKKLMEDQKGWSAEDWLYWMDPFNRPIYLISTKLTSEAKGEMVFASYELMQLNGATEWMLKVCDIEVERIQV